MKLKGELRKRVREFRAREFNLLSYGDREVDDDDVLRNLIHTANKKR